MTPPSEIPCLVLAVFHPRRQSPEPRRLDESIPASPQAAELRVETAVHLHYHTTTTRLLHTTTLLLPGGKVESRDDRLDGLRRAARVVASGEARRGTREPGVLLYTVVYYSIQYYSGRLVQVCYCILYYTILYYTILYSSGR